MYSPDVGICEIRLLYRSKQRGYLELDLVLGKWVEENIHSMDENGVKSLFDVLELVIKFFIYTLSFVIAIAIWKSYHVVVHG